MDMQQEIMGLREAIARIETKLDSWPKCPHPGMCNVLEPRIRVLEDNENQRKGGWVSLTAMLAIASAIGALLTNFLKFRQ